MEDADAHEFVRSRSAVPPPGGTTWTPACTESRPDAGAAFPGSGPATDAAHTGAW